MSTGIASVSTRAVFAALAASAVALTACDSRTASQTAPLSASVGFLDPSDTGRQRNDPGRGRIWIVNSQGVFVFHTRTGKLEEVTLPSWQWADTPYACPPDLAIGPAGEALVTSNVVSVLWRIDPRTLSVTMHELALNADNDKDVGFSQLAYSAEHGAFFAINETHGSQWRIDSSLREARKIAGTEPARGACGVTVPRGE
jgi:hypothetical protein